MAGKNDETEGTVPFGVLADAERLGTEEGPQTAHINSDAEPNKLPNSKAAMFCYIIGGMGVVIGILLMLADEYSVPAPFLTGLVVVIANGFIICSGAAIQYLYDIRSLLKSSREAGAVDA